MAIPEFDERGNLPPGRHEADLDEVRARFVVPFAQSASRSGIFEYWRHHRAALEELVPVDRQLLAGSFVSDKRDPADVDIITVIDGPAYDALPKHRQMLARMLIAGHYTEAMWLCDSHPVLSYPVDHPGHSRAVIGLERYLDYFGHDRDGSERGVVEVPGG